MNCANHPDLPVAAYCQNCGKPLCTQCVRSVAGVVYCEPCLAARLHGPAVPVGSATPAGAGPRTPGAGWSPVQDPAFGVVPPPGIFRGSVSPVLAGLLGIIPGVGAMYNGQFIKALAHVVVFIILIGVTNHFPLAGLLISAWVFYQIFDSVQTAIARRDGLPLPDPFGLNDLGNRLGMPASAAYAGAPRSPGTTAGPIPGSPNPSQAPFTADPITGNPAEGVPPSGPGGQPDWNAWANRVAAAHAEQSTGVPVGSQFAPGQYAPVQPPLIPSPVAYGGRSEPVGAIVLIAVGILFLLSTLGVFQLDWVERGWPVLIIIIGAWLLIRRARRGTAGGGL